MAVREWHEPVRYDEDALAGALRALPPSRRVRFACACAERLMPAYRWYCNQTGLGDFAVIREALDAAWSAGREEDLPSSPEIPRWRQRVEAIVPSDDEDETFPGSAVAENAVACVAYALRTWETAEPQDAVWAARQVYEAADVVVQHRAPAQTYIDDVDFEPPVQLMLRGVYAALQDTSTVDDLLAGATADGQGILKYLIGVD